MPYKNQQAQNAVNGYSEVGPKEEENIEVSPQQTTEEQFLRQQAEIENRYNNNAEVKTDSTAKTKTSTGNPYIRPDGTGGRILYAGDGTNNPYDNKVGDGTKMMDKVFGNSYNISPKEEAKRMRRARTAGMIGNLGNLMSAFANLFYVNKGAPSATVPEAVKVDYSTFQDKVNAARKEAATRQMAREQYAKEQEWKQKNYDLQVSKDVRAEAKAKQEHEIAIKKIDEMEAKINAQNARTASYESMTAARNAQAKVNEARAMIAQGQLALGYAKLAEAEREFDLGLDFRKQVQANKEAGTTATSVKNDGFTTTTTTTVRKSNALSSTSPSDPAATSGKTDINKWKRGGSNNNQSTTRKNKAPLD